MKKLLVILLASLPVLQATAQDFKLYEKKKVEKDGHVLPYRILYPESMEKGEKYPLFVFLHGMGKRGTNNESQLELGAELFLRPENRQKYPAIVLYPQAPKTSAFVEVVSDGEVIAGGFGRSSRQDDDARIRFSPYGSMVYDVMTELIDSGVVDTDRIYISGSSMGGFSTYQFIAEYPDLFAAAVPMASGTDIRQVEKWAGKVPVWIVHGDQDKVVPVSSSRIIVKRLKELGVECRYTEYPGVEHKSWDNAFAEPDYLEWIFSHSKKRE